MILPKFNKNGKIAILLKIMNYLCTVIKNTFSYQLCVSLAVYMFSKPEITELT